jgi:hypothetical protein
LTIKDAASATQNMSTTDDASGNCQYNVVTEPAGVTSTITTAAPTAGTFSSILASSTTRKGCTIQNNSSSLAYFYPGTTGSATTSNAFQVSSGQLFYCNAPNVVLQDNIAATCASGTCAFVINTY